MTDLLVAAAISAAMAGCLVGLRISRRRAHAMRAISRLRGGPARSVSRKVRNEKRALLSGFAVRLSKSNLGARFEAYVARAHPQITFSDAVALTLAAAFGGFLLGMILFGGGPAVALSMVAGPFILDRVLTRAGGRRAARLEAQLPDALALQASALRAGHSTVRSLGILAAEIPAPLGEEMEIASREIDLGRSLEAAVGRLESRVGSPDIELWVTAMLVHRLAGGNLSTILDSLADRIRQRAHIRAEIRALTAQGRLSGVVVAAAPLAFFVMLSVTSRDQMRILYTTPTGFVLLLAGLGLIGAGFVWIRWVLRIKP